MSCYSCENAEQGGSDCRCNKTMVEAARDGMDYLRAKWASEPREKKIVVPELVIKTVSPAEAIISSLSNELNRYRYCSDKYPKLRHGRGGGEPCYSYTYTAAIIDNLAFCYGSFPSDIQISDVFIIVSPNEELVFKTTCFGNYHVSMTVQVPKDPCSYEHVYKRDWKGSDLAHAYGYVHGPWWEHISDVIIPELRAFNDKDEALRAKRRADEKTQKTNERLQNLRSWKPR